MSEPKRLSVKDIVEVYFRAPSTILDGIHPVTGKCVWGSTDYASEPGVERITFDEALERQANHWRSPPSEIPYQTFQDALEVLPPVDWCNWTTSESFKMSERTSGSITAIYCRIGAEPDQARYYCLHDCITTPHDEIVRLCKGASS